MELIMDIFTTSERLEEYGTVKIDFFGTIWYNSVTINWNDWRSRHVFLCFYLALFQLMSVKFQTSAYNSRTVWSSYMKFWQQFEINELYVCTKFRGNRSLGFGFRTRKPPRKFGVKSGLSQKRLKCGKKYFIRLYVSRYPFIPTNRLLAAMRFISFFFLFFFLNFVRSSSPKPQHIEIWFLCKVVEPQMQLFLPKFFGATPPKINFLSGSS